MYSSYSSQYDRRNPLVGSSLYSSRREAYGETREPEEVCRINATLHDGSRLSSNSNLNATIEEVVQGICRQGYGHEKNLYCFDVLISGTKVEDASLRLRDVVPGKIATLQITRKSEGGLTMGHKIGPSMGFDFNDMTKLVKHEFSKSGGAPRWRKIYHGVTWRSTCLNPLCAAYEETVNCKGGFGHLNVGREVNRVKCPECKQGASRATNVMFYKCRWSYEGKPVGSEAERNGRGVADTHNFYTFEDGAEIKWEWLELTVDRLR
mmetsp:Transcript_34375/g.60248  ORF Transcript_34375/g.60248 Transcript_34375/m.60248 type:complete len:264 (+) Transcript_34375:150-941(+)